MMRYIFAFAVAFGVGLFIHSQAVDSRQQAEQRAEQAEATRQRAEACAKDEQETALRSNLHRCQFDYIKSVLAFVRAFTDREVSRSEMDSITLQVISAEKR